MKKLILALLLIATFNVSAAPVRFDFIFADPDSTARTTGYIVFEADLLSNPVDVEIVLPSPVVLDLQLTVTGSVYSDGDYDINDYQGVTFWSNGGVFDFSRPLIGQPTDGAPWGSDFDEEAGDFNLFTNRGELPLQQPPQTSSSHDESGQGIEIVGPPNGCWWFTLCEESDIGQEGEGERPVGLSPMRLQFMQRSDVVPASHAIPSLSFWSTLALALAFLFMAGLFRRRLS